MRVLMLRFEETRRVSHAAVCTLRAGDETSERCFRYHREPQPRRWLIACPSPHGRHQFTGDSLLQPRQVLLDSGQPAGCVQCPSGPPGLSMSSKVFAARASAATFCQVLTDHNAGAGRTECKVCVTHATSPISPGADHPRREGVREHVNPESTAGREHSATGRRKSRTWSSSHFW